MKLDLDDTTITYLARSAKTAQKVESVFVAKVKAQIAARVENIIYALENNSAMPAVDFASIYTQLMLEALEKGYSTETQIRLASDRGFAPARGKKKTLFDFWKERADRGYRPKRLEVLARKTQKRFDAAMEKLHEMWKNPEVRHDKEYSRILVKSALVSTESYASMVVATETTRYYNKARRDFYDAVPQVTHYMFVSIRDSRTTPWCKTRQHLIYEKGSAYLERETPPLHPNCRSEILPLMPLNPKHKKLIDDESMWRENNSPVPLIKGWNS
jgi:SPP1 gp7 family putative phage head morphogenesis protein